MTRSARTSFYLPMRDGVRLAVDLHLPAEAATGPVPAMVHQTRYFRSLDLRRPWVWTPLARKFDELHDLRAAFLGRGIAWVDVCVRGSGASTGHRPHPWAVEEVEDGREVLDWIVAQPWSSGRVGSMGVSYSGTTSEFLATLQHPALVAIAPTFALYDVYTDIAFPGGLQLRFFTENWGRFNALLDADDHGGAFASILRHSARGWADDRDRKRARLLRLGDRDLVERAARAFAGALARGVAAVDGDKLAREGVREAVAAHADNFDVHAGAVKMVHRDDAGMTPHRPEVVVDDFSPHARAQALRDSGVAVYSYSGWYDGTYQHAAIKRHRAIGNAGSQLVIGGWDHGGAQDISPFTSRVTTDFDHIAQWLAFFAPKLDLTGRHDDLVTAEHGSRVRYFTLGEERWKQADTWPPSGFSARSFHLDRGRRLIGAEAPADAGVEPYTVDRRARTGWRSRWNTLIGTAAPVGYGDRAPEAERLLTFTSEPLDRDTEVTGHPVLHLWVETSEPDGAFFAYLHDVAPGGRTEYVTEGLLRARHRQLSDATPPYPHPGPYRTFRSEDALDVPPGEPIELVFDLLPTSYRIQRGHRLQLALAGADADHFDPVTAEPARWRVLTGADHPSRIELPIRD